MVSELGFVGLEVLFAFTRAAIISFQTFEILATRLAPSDLA